MSDLDGTMLTSSRSDGAMPFGPYRRKSLTASY